MDPFRPRAARRMDLPRRIGRYEIRARLASGATAEVFLARAPGTPDVALKRLHPHLAHDAEAIAQLLDEARLAARLEHPSAVPVIDLGCEEGAWFVAFEHVSGCDLAMVLSRLSARGELLPVPIAVALACELAAAVGALHQIDGEGLVHGDVTPANVLLARDGSVRLTDLGACAALARGTPGVFGTPGYVAPEQVRRAGIGPAADVFSLGAILFELVTGRAAFPREVLPGLAAPLDGLPPEPCTLRPELPPEVGAAAMRALDARPRRRFQSAEAFIEALRPFAASEDAARLRLSTLLAELCGP
jgi:eukaryotic-like serine/threonine-protein kinase